MDCRPAQGATTSTTDDSEAEQLASEVLSELAEGISTLAADRSVVSWNPHAERLTGYTLEQINAVGLVEIFDPREVMDHLLREAHDGLTTFGERLRLRQRDGTLVHSMYSARRCSTSMALKDGWWSSYERWPSWKHASDAMRSSPCSGASRVPWPMKSAIR
jgi:PAS domain S-box-containing protein